jgi:hypothetical protein
MASTAPQDTAAGPLNETRCALQNPANNGTLGPGATRRCANAVQGTYEAPAPLAGAARLRRRRLSPSGIRRPVAPPIEARGAELRLGAVAQPGHPFNPKTRPRPTGPTAGKRGAPPASAEPGPGPFQDRRGFHPREIFHHGKGCS